MLTILMQTIVNTNNNILAKITANTNTNAFVTILFCFYIQQRSFFCGHLLIKLIKWLLSKNGKIIIFYSDMMLLSKQCSSIYCRRKNRVLTFTLSVTVMLLLTELTGASDNKSIGIEYCQETREKVSPTHISILHMKSVADTIGSSANAAILTTAAIFSKELFNKLNKFSQFSPCVLVNSWICIISPVVKIFKQYSSTC